MYREVVHYEANVQIWGFSQSNENARTMTRQRTANDLTTLNCKDNFTIPY